MSASDVLDIVREDEPSQALRCLANLCARALPMFEHQGGVEAPRGPTDWEIQSVENDLTVWTGKLRELDAMTGSDVRAKIAALRGAALKVDAEHKLYLADQRGRLAALAARAESWTPPTPAHEPVKVRMMAEIREAYRYLDVVTKPEPLPDPDAWQEWLARERAQAVSVIERCTTRLAQMRESQKTVAQWLTAFHASFESAP